MNSPSKINELSIIIGHKIRRLRELNRITQVQLRKEVGFKSTGTISQVEAGVRGLKRESILKVAKYFGVHPAVLTSPVAIEDYSDFNLLSKIIVLIEMKHERPEVVQPLLAAMNGLLEHLPASYWESLKPGF